MMHFTIRGNLLNCTDLSWERNGKKLEECPLALVLDVVEGNNRSFEDPE